MGGLLEWAQPSLSRMTIPSFSSFGAGRSTTDPLVAEKTAPSREQIQALVRVPPDIHHPPSNLRQWRPALL